MTLISYACKQQVSRVQPQGESLEKTRLGGEALSVPH